MTEETELQPMLRGGSPSCNNVISWPSSPGVADVSSYLELSPQPPAQVPANDDLPIVALLTCHPEQLQNISIIAVATLLNHIGEELPGKLLGDTVASGQLVSTTSTTTSTTTRFCFTLGFPDPGKYRVGINLERIRTGQDDDSWLNVKSEEITVTSFKKDPNQDSEGMNSEGMNLVPLRCREADDIEYTCTELFPWKTSISPPPRVVLGGITYDKHTVLIPEAEIFSAETDLYDEPDFSTGAYGEGLFIRDGKWYEIDENEERSLVMEEDEVLDGDDGRKYRRSIGCLRSNYVGLRREVVTINTVRHISHLVLVDSGKYWNGEHRSVISVALSLDGTRLAEASDDTVKIWDTAIDVALLTLDGHTDAVFSVAFSPDGTKIASASADKTLNIWDTNTGALLWTLDGHTDAVLSVAFSPDDTKIASASADKTLNIWDTNTGALLWTLEGNIAGIFSFSLDGTKIASASANKTLNIWDTNTGALLWTLDGHTNTVLSVAFSPDGTRIASASADKTLNIWDTTTGALVLRLENHTCNAVLLLFSPDGKLLAFSSREAMWLWDYTTDATPQRLWDNSGKFVGAGTMTFSPDGKELISASLDMDMWRWDTTTSLQLSWKNLISPIADIELLQPPPEKAQADVALPILLQPNKTTLSKRPSDGDIGGDLRNEKMKKRMEGRKGEWQKLRNLYPDLDPTTAQILEETRSAMDNEWVALVEKLKETKDIWDSQKIIEELLKLINQCGLNLHKVERERKRMIYSSQGQSTVKQDRLFDFKLLLEKLEQLRNISEEVSTQLPREEYCDSEDIMTKLKEARSVIPDATSSRGVPTPLDYRATGAPAHKHDGIKPNDELEEHPSQLDAINSKPERGRPKTEELEFAASFLPTMLATEEHENDMEVVAMWKSVAIGPTDS